MLKARKGLYSMQGCSYWEETVVTNRRIYFKQRQSDQYKPYEKFKMEIFNGESVAPPT